MVLSALRGVVLGKFGAQAAGLDANHGVELGIKVGLAAKKLSGNLVFLDGSTGMVQGLPGKITEEFAKGFRAMKRLALGQLFHCGEVLRPVAHAEPL